MPVTLLTDTGETKLTTAAGSGSHVSITQIALGDAGGRRYDPTHDMTALVNERVRRDIDSADFDGEHTWYVRAEFPTDTPSFAVREIGFFDQDGDLIAIWAGADVQSRQTGVIVYLVEHALSFSRVAEGLIMVDAPPIRQIKPGQMVLAKSGRRFEGYLECDGSVVDVDHYPNLASLGYEADQPAAVVDLGASGRLIFPVTVRWGGADHTYYHLDRNKDGAGGRGDYVTLDTLEALFNDGAHMTDEPATRSGTLNGVEVRLPTLGADWPQTGEYTFAQTTVADPATNNTTYSDLLAIWDAVGLPPGWTAGRRYRSSTPREVDNVAHISINFKTGECVESSDSVLFAVALEVIDPPQETVLNLPDSATLGAPSGFSFYIRY